MGLGGHGDGAVESVGEGHEALIAAAGLGQGEELGLGGLDLVTGRTLGVALGGLLGDLAADADQVAAQGQVVDGAGIVRRVCGGRRPVHQVGQVADAAKFLESRVAVELFGQQDRFGQLALPDRTLDRRPEPLVERLVEVPGLQEVTDPLEGGVVVEEGAQQSLFGLDVGWGVRDRGVVLSGAEV